MSYVVYILESQKNGQYYVGSTSDIIARLKSHNGGRVKSTKPYRLWTLLYTEEHPMLGSARKREQQIKSWKKRAHIERLIRKG